MNRLDIELVNRGLFSSRSRSQMEVKSGNIYCDGKCITKPSFLVNENTKINIKSNIIKYVSRAGLKLEYAVNTFKIDLNNKIMIDIGSSTGGFSDFALQSNIKKIYAIDVGTNQLVDKIRNNSKVNVYEKTDFRYIDNKLINDANIATIDVSFISVTKLMDKLNELDNIKEIICLIKPQFECGKENADKYKGIPLKKDIHIDVIKKVVNSFKNINFELENIDVSKIRGGDGNIEYVSYFIKNGKTKNIDFVNIVEKCLKN